MSSFPRTLHHYGFTVDVHRGGRRVWPPSFKRFIRKSLDQGDLCVDDVVSECNVSKSLVYKWRADVKGLEDGPSCPNATFSEVLIQDTATESNPHEMGSSLIHLRGEVVDMILPADYDVENLIKLIASLEGSCLSTVHEGELDPFSGAIFVFRSKRADRLKIIVWDGTDLVLIHKRLEGKGFVWPRSSEGIMTFSKAQFEILFEGLDWRRVATRKTGHPLHRANLDRHALVSWCNF